MATDRLEGTRRDQGWGRRLRRLTVHRAGGPFIFAGVIWIAFKMTTDLAAPFIDWIDAVVAGPLYRWLAGLLALIGLGETWVQSLVVDGALAGVGTVLAFIPVLVTLYLVLAVLEQSGYLARGARSVENGARMMGLPGSALLPMSLGFGCTVPALLALRNVEKPRDRVLAGLLVPFMACAARLPVFVLLATAFFVDHRALVVFSMYMLGIVVALVLGMALGTTVLRTKPGDRAALRPLPPLRLPSYRMVMDTVRSRTASFIRGAGTVVLAASLGVWLLLSIPLSGSGSFAATPVEDSAFAGVSRTMAPIMEPIGLGDWKQTGALLTGLIAKEVTISTLAQAYGLGGESGGDADPGFFDDLASIGSGFVGAARDALVAVPGIVGIDLRGDAEEQSPAMISAIREGFDEESEGRGSAAGLAFMVFVLLYTPCVVALATTRRELGLRWMWVSAVGQLLVAWVVAYGAFNLAIGVGLG